MNREIKFRVWLNAGFYGSSNSHFHYFDIFDKPFINYLCDAKYLKENFDKKLVINGLLFQEPKIQQFPGLKDKNGKEIYEGDIIKRRNFFISGLESVKKEEYDIFAVEWASAGFWNFAINDTNKTPALFEVIGNIHENPELLK